MSIRGGRWYNQNCAEFNGVDEYMQRTGSLSFRSDTAGAWSMWVSLDAVFSAAGQQMTLAFTRDPAQQDRITFGPRRIAATGTGTFMSLVWLNGATTIGYSGTTTALSANTWYHVVIQSNGTAWSMYVNGTLQTLTRWSGAGTNTGDWFGDFAGSTGSLFVSAQINGNAISNYFDGRLDQFMYIGGRALTAGEVTETYNGGIPKDPRSLSYTQDIDIIFRFGDRGDTASTMLDRIGDNDMTLVNMDATNYVPV